MGHASWGAVSLACPEPDVRSVPMEAVDSRLGPGGPGDARVGRTPAASSRGVTRPARGAPGVAVNDAPFLLSLDEAEREHIIRALEACGGNKKMAAELLGINRSSLYVKLKRLGITCEMRVTGVR